MEREGAFLTTRATRKVGSGHGWQEGEMEGNLQNSASKSPNHRCLGFPRREHVLDQQDGDENQSRLGDDVDCADDTPAHDLRIVSKSEIRCIFTTEREREIQEY
jgi:hypothetical protein